MGKINKPVSATYRIQLTPDFDFTRCAEIIPYLSDLGISHIYLSPFFQAESGSQSGYDVVDNQHINQELGGQKGLQKLLKNMPSSMGIVLDIVPNHISIKTCKNKLWMDVLKNGPKSRFAHYFDINWSPPQKKIKGKVLLPILADHYKNEIQNGRIQIKKHKNEYFINYYDLYLPLNSRSLKLIKGQTANINKDICRLDEILNMQFYFLSFWRGADYEINYRRFFTINHLIGLRIEEPDVFNYVHKLIFVMIEKGQLDGLRIDHIDGLRRPTKYLNRLRKKAPKTWIAVEKILGSNEYIPKDWPIQGTTGYDYLNLINGLFVNPAAKQQLTNLYQKLAGPSASYRNLLYEKKFTMLNNNFASETNRLVNLLEQIAMKYKDFRDLTSNQLRQGLSIIMSNFAVYRTYIDNLNEPLSSHDKNYIEQALLTSKQKNPQIHPIVWDFFGDLLSAKMKGKIELEFILRFQQLTVPLMAKGAEDTAFYCFDDLISLNEVGGNPSKFGTSIEEFHNFCTRMQKDWPLTLVATSTHDTKRSEDVRMRINMISEIPRQWQEAVTQWFEHNKKYHFTSVPSSNDEYFIYQTLVGIWPIELRRIKDLTIKAVREAKVRSNWTNINQQYETELISFIENILKDKEFIESLGTFISIILEPARISFLSQTLIKYTVPGIPDLYQGAELWDLSLVDPDNRRPVDYELRKNIFLQMQKMTAADALRHLNSGLTKMFVIHRCLQVRKQYFDCFGKASTYKPLQFTGAKANHLIGFMRKEKIIIIAPTFLITLNNDWQDTEISLPEGTWTDFFTNKKFENKTKIKNILNDFPLAMLIKEN